MKECLDESVARLKQAIDSADAVVVGAGAGLSTAAGFIYEGERFRLWFGDFAAEYGIRDMYSGGFYPFPDDGALWAWWARAIYCNRYITPPRDVYQRVLSLLTGKDYFVITTNVDHQFQKAGIDKSRLFYTQGDFGLFQSTNPAIQKTYDNYEWTVAAMEAEGFKQGANGEYAPELGGRYLMHLPQRLIPKCPDDGGEVDMNLRVDDTFVEDEGWHLASNRYEAFLERVKIAACCSWRLGLGNNTPAIIKYPFWRMAEKNPLSTYACINANDAACSRAISKRAIVIPKDIESVLPHLERARCADD